MVGMIAHWLDRRHAKKRLILPDDVSSSADRDGC
jgi:citrate synthase